MTTLSKFRGSRFVTQFPVFYGWVVAVAATLVLLLPYIGNDTTIGLFIDDLIAEYHLDQTTIAALLGIGGLVAGLTLPRIGRIIDYRGSRLTFLVAGVLYAVTLIAVSQAGSALTFLLLYVAMRTLGHGPLYIVGGTVIAQWFRSKRGRVMGITVVVIWLVQSIYTPWMQQLVETHGWRTFWGYSGLLIGLVAIPVLWLLLRDRPEEFGLLPDGAAQTDALPAPEEHWTLREAQRTVLFWVFAAGRVVGPVVGASLILYQVIIFKGLGHAPQVAAQTFGLVSIAAALSSVVVGYLIDRVRPGLIMVVQMAAMAVSVVMAMTMTETWMLVVYAVNFGAAIAIGQVFDNAVLPNLFGRRHLGEIRGFMATAVTLGAAVGPILFGWCYETFGSYNPLFYVFLALFGVQMILSWAAPHPQRQPQPVVALQPSGGD
jgi:MFS family permease